MGSSFDRFCQLLAQGNSRRTTLKLMGTAALAAWLPGRLSAQGVNCGGGLSQIQRTANVASCGPVAVGIACTVLAATLEAAFVTSGSCAAPCPPVLQNFNCGVGTCAANVVTATASATCTCVIGTNCSRTCCIPSQNCCGGACVANSCTSCGPSCTACPQGTCCLNGVCTSSVGGVCGRSPIC